MRYTPTFADKAPAPASYATEERYIGYRDIDRAKPYASFFEPTVAPPQPQVHEAAAIGRFPSKHGYSINDAATRMSRPGYEEMETGYTQLENGDLQVSVLTRMPNVTADMWDWWFGWHSTETARYKLWHPEAHYYTFIGDDRRSNRSLTDRQRYRNNVSYVDEYLGAEKNQLTVRFYDPAIAGFEDRPGTTVIAARGGLSTAPICTAWLIHQVRPTEDGVEMRSRFFIESPQLLKIPAASVTSRRGRILTTPIGHLARPLIKRAKIFHADEFGPAMLLHCAQEMNHLSRFLPRLYEAFRGTP